MKAVAIYLVAVVITMRVVYVGALLFTTNDLAEWKEHLLKFERRIVRFLAELGMSREEKRKVAEMRRRISNGLPP